MVVSTGNLKFVEKSSLDSPVISELWEIALGLNTGGFSPIIERQLA